MIRLISASLFCSFVFTWGCHSRQDKDYEELRTVIVGEIIGYKKLDEKAKFSFRDIYDERKNHTDIEIVLEEGGTFRIDTILQYPQEITTEYGSIYCHSK